jgi:hypothetical protein
MLARLHGSKGWQFHADTVGFEVRDLERGLRVEQSLRRSIDADGLAAWLLGEST